MTSAPLLARGSCWHSSGYGCRALNAARPGCAGPLAALGCPDAALPPGGLPVSPGLPVGPGTTSATCMH